MGLCCHKEEDSHFGEAGEVKSQPGVNNNLNHEQGGYNNGGYSSTGYSSQPQQSSAGRNSGAAPADQQIAAYLNALNAIRQNPSSFVQKIQSLYIDRLTTSPDGRPMDSQTNLVYNEGSNIFSEAQNFLRNARPLSPLTLESGLCKAAQGQSAYCAKVFQPTHSGPSGDQPQQRILQYGRFEGYGVQASAENCGMSIDSNPERWLLDLVIDDGVPNRGHRKNIFDPNYQKIGLGYTKGQNGYQTSYFSVMNFASDSYHSN